jgi:hypothetical protein
MKNELKINQLSEEAFEWYQLYLQAIDATDTEKYGEFLAEDCEFQLEFLSTLPHFMLDCNSN